MILRLLYLLILIPVFLRAEVAESWEKNQVLVGDEVVYRLNYTNVEKWNIPEKGFLYDEKKSTKDKGLPFAKIEEVKKSPGKIEIRVIFLEPGEFFLPVSWEDPISGDLLKPTESIRVESSLKNEKQLLDISEPIKFSGPYLVRLLILLSVGVLIIGITLYSLYYISKKYKAEPKDAIIQKPYELKQSKYYENTLNDLIQKKQIYHKEFLFALSGFIKERLEYLYSSPCLHLEFEELKGSIRRRCGFSEEEFVNVCKHFNSIKYMPNDELIPVQEAIKQFEYWKDIL